MHKLHKFAGTFPKKFLALCHFFFLIYYTIFSFFLVGLLPQTVFSKQKKIC